MLPQSFFPRLVALAIGLMLLLVPPRRAGAELTAEQERFFESKIRPILATRCSECHGPDAQESGLRVDSLQGLLDGGQRGPAIVPGDAQRSLLIHAVQHSEADLQMPEGEKLSGEEIRALVQWVDQGAFWPGQRAERRRPTWDTGTEVTAEDRQFWAFQPPRRPVLPLVKNRPWCRTPIDYFVLAELEKQGIAPAPPASPRTLVRRVYLDLWGLPPTPEQIDAFVADPSPDAYARLVDRLLASPRYGERWGRHWLDVARYADSNGLDENWAFEHIYRYRDWVLTAFNRDMPYDRFVQYQLAGDLMTPAGDEPFEERVQRLAATGFLSVGPKMIADDDPIKKKMDIVDEQLSTIGQTFLGLTIGCARCHDHKFDPIPTRDYYALAGILKSTRTMEHLKVVAPVWIHELHPPGFAEQLAAFEKRRRELLDQRDAFWRQVAGPAYLAARSSENSEGNQQDDSGAPAASTSSTYELPEEKELAKWVPEEQRQRWEELQAAIAEHETTRPQPVRVMGPTEGDVGDIPISLRGNYLTPGPVVPRGFLQVLTPPGVPPPELLGSGRLELARWITHPSHPLTPRVFVNRLWRWRFGRGIVPTTDNFGRLGERPTHPELLDWLAVEFVESGWSMKRLHRLMLLSATYQMSSTAAADAAQRDPQNELWSRFPRRRLEAEAIRDAILAVSGQLDTRFGGSLMPLKDRTYVTGTASKQQQYDNPRRSVYQPIYRSAVYDFLAAFDFPDPATPTGDRQESVIAPQSLVMMNSELVHQASAKLAEWVWSPSDDPQTRVERLWQRVLGRPPHQAELEAVLRYMTTSAADAAGQGEDGNELEQWAAVARVLLCSNEFLYID